MAANFSYNYTTIHTCDSDSGWSDNASRTIGDYQAKQGSHCMEIYGSSGWRYWFTEPSEFSVMQQDVMLWFLYVKGKASKYIYDVNDACTIRLWDVYRNYYADYHMGGHTTLQASWQNLLVSGDQPNYKNGAIDFNRINKIELRLNMQSGNGGTGESSFAIDWVKRGNTIIVCNGTLVSPMNFDGMYTWDVLSAIGLVYKEDTFVKLWAGLQIGDGSTPTVFSAENMFVYNDQYSDAVHHNIVVKNNATLILGKKLTGAEGDVYAINGCSLVTKEGRTADITVEPGGTLLVYGTKVFRFRNVQFGTSSGQASQIEINRCDFDTNYTVDFRTNNLSIKDTQLHHPTSNSIGVVYNEPATLENIQVHNASRGLTIRDSMALRNYWAKDNTYDIAIQDGKSVDLVNSIFNPGKILQV
jgi:hypothetical protein